MTFKTRVSLVLFLLFFDSSLALSADITPTPGVVAAVLTAPAAIEAAKAGGSTTTTATETPTQTQTTTSVTTTPKTATEPAVVRATTTIVQEKPPQDMVGWAGGAMHNLPVILAWFGIFMGVMRAGAEVLTELSVFFYTVARFTGSKRLKEYIELLAWGLSILAWIVGIFAAGSPKEFAGPTLPPPARPDIT